MTDPSSPRREVSHPVEARDSILAKLVLLVDQARLTPSTSPFMHAQMDEICSLMLSGVLDSQRLDYLAADPENLRALYDLMERADDDDPTPSERIRELLDEFIEMDAEASDV